MDRGGSSLLKLETGHVSFRTRDGDEAEGRALKNCQPIILQIIALSSIWSDSLNNIVSVG